MKLVSIIFSLLLCSSAASAQLPFNTIDSIDINNINASVLVHGDMWWDPARPGFVAACKFPKDSLAELNLEGSVWMSGYDGGGALHIAAQTYRQSGNDYWPGPLAGAGAISYAESQNWAKIWKVNRSDVEYFLSLAVHTVANTPAAILTWPGKGNTNAAGNGGVALTVLDDMAPFVDINGNGIYEPLLGEYPQFDGDQVLWWVFNDNGPTHNQTNGRPLGVEVHCMAYAYSRGTLIDDVVYYDYRIVNRSANNYDNFRFAQWDRPHLSARLEPTYDNFVGFDSTWRMGIAYRGDLGGTGISAPRYSDSLQTAVTMVSLPGDAAATYVPAGSFTYYNDDISIIGEPTNDTEYNNYMRSRIRDGEHISNDYTVPGVPCRGFSADNLTNYVFTGDPGIDSQWSMCKCNDGPADIRFVAASNDFSLAAGGAQHIVMALLALGSIEGCPHTSFDQMRILADTAWNIYHNPLLPSVTKNTHSSRSPNVYPDPATDRLNIDWQDAIEQKDVLIFDVYGRNIHLPIARTAKGWQADISGLINGLYFVRCACNAQLTSKFLKQ